MSYEQAEGLTISRTFIIHGSRETLPAGTPRETILSVGMANYRTIADKLKEVGIMLDAAKSRAGVDAGGGSIPVAYLANNAVVDLYTLPTSEGDLEISLKDFSGSSGGRKGVIGGNVTTWHGIEGMITGKCQDYEGVDSLKGRMAATENALTELYGSLRKKTPFELPQGIFNITKA